LASFYQNYRKEEIRASLGAGRKNGVVVVVVLWELRPVPAWFDSTGPETSSVTASE